MCRLRAQGGDGERAAQLAATVLAPKLVDLLVQSWNALDGLPALDPAFDRLRQALAAEPGSSAAAGAGALRAVLEAMQRGGSMAPGVLARCAQLVRAVLGCLSGPAAAEALRCGELRRTCCDALVALLSAASAR